MSKSHPLPNSRIMITDTDKEISSKIKSAVTDSSSGITFDPVNRPGVANLLTILAECTDDTPEEAAVGLSTSAQLKDAVSEATIKTLTPIRDNFYRLSKEHEYLDNVARQGKERASVIANDTMNQVRKHVGLD